MRFVSFLRSLVVLVLVAIVLVTSLLLFLLNLDWLLSYWDCSRVNGCSCCGSSRNSFLHLDIILSVCLLLLVMLTSSVALLEAAPVFLAPLVVCLGVGLSARLYLLEIFHVVYILAYFLIIY